VLGQDAEVMRRLVAAVLVLGVLAACSADGGEPDGGADRSPGPTSAAPEPAPAPPRPANDRCFRLTYDDRAQEQLATECPRRLARFVGGSEEQRRLSMLSTTWFGPTVDASDDGQTWFRCDVIALASPGELAPLGGKLRGVLGRGAGRDRYGRCAATRPGVKDFRHVLCSRNDAWRAIATRPVPAGKGGAWPGRVKAEAAGSTCADEARPQADDTLNFRWGFEFPTREQWRSGRRYGFCWVPRAS
jgi:hypothetical protein